jgi:threonyl-tRNA synthetase
MENPVDVMHAPASCFFVLNSLGVEEALPADGNYEQFDSGLGKLIMATVGSDKSVHFARHMNIIRRLEWADNETASDKGHFRYYPNGALVYQLLVEWCEQVAVDAFGALPIRTPFLYLSDSQAVKGQIGMFEKNVYPVYGGQNHDEFVLRFNDDLGLFAVMKDSQLTHRHLPIRIYEHTPSFRYIQSGTLAGISKGRYFSLTDVHSFCGDIEQGFVEYVEIQKILKKVAKGVGIDLTIHFKVTRDFYPTAKTTMVAMLSGQEKMLVEMIPGQRQYWAMKHIACTDHPQRLFHIQFDLDNSERFDIKYVASDGSRKNCVIIHTALGTPERWMVIAVEDALKKDPPTLPLWLSPTQVRIIPVSEEKHVDFCVGVARELKQRRIRVDVDERSEKMGWRIRAAEREWIPYIVVCGDKEQEGAPLSVRVRGGKQIQTNVSDLADLIHRQTSEMPFRSLPGMLVSKRPVFRGRD